MESELIKIAVSQGLWATLAVVLILYILKAQEKRDQKQAERETKYQEIIKNLSHQLNIVTDLKQDIKDIKNHIISSK
ncbi:BhlA/UviB family holin-like peptide [Longirhabdus pacifica]|uniref:BhlA/UviB family holin-like peptide n=1 Tax=Longirhabdus pacifica TaxID=2305227 RepID=UPI001008FBAC|nr:BhlA/UviB family holin-like peptide [Longirhabdus pacifica]